MELPLRSFFEAPPVVGLAEAVVRGLTEKAEDEEVARILAELKAPSDEQK